MNEWMVGWLDGWGMTATIPGLDYTAVRPSKSNISSRNRQISVIFSNETLLEPVLRIRIYINSTSKYGSLARLEPDPILRRP